MRAKNVDENDTRLEDVIKNIETTEIKINKTCIDSKIERNLKNVI